MTSISTLHKKNVLLLHEKTTYNFKHNQRDLESASLSRESTVEVKFEPSHSPEGVYRVWAIVNGLHITSNTWIMKKRRPTLKRAQKFATLAIENVVKVEEESKS